MNYNYKLFDANGLLIYGTDKPISQGNNAVDIFYFSFEGHDYNDSYVTVSATLPNGNTLPELATSNTEFEFKEEPNKKGYKFVVLEPLTSLSGTLTLTVNLLRKSDDRKLCSSQINVRIYESDISTEPTITDAQYQQVLQSIDDSYQDLDDFKLYKYFKRYSGTTDVSENDIIAINSGVTHDEVKYTPIKNVYNIEEINGIKPVNKKITVTSKDITYEETTVEQKLGEIDTKVNINEGVFHRNGGLTDSDSVPTGVLNHTTDEYNDGTDWARILLTDTNFKTGDIIDCDLTLEITDTTEGTLITYDTVHVTRVLNGSFEQFVVVKLVSGIRKFALVGNLFDNILAMRVLATNDISIKLSIENSIVRR